MGIKENNLNMKALSERIAELERTKAQVPVITREEIERMREALAQCEKASQMQAEMDSLSKEVSRIQSGLSKSESQCIQAKSQMQGQAKRITDLEENVKAQGLKLEARGVGEDMFAWSRLSTLGKVMLVCTLGAAVIGVAACLIVG